jgi:hypothetical protein
MHRRSRHRREHLKVGAVRTGALTCCIQHDNLEDTERIRSLRHYESAQNVCGIRCGSGQATYYETVLRHQLDKIALARNPSHRKAKLNAIVARQAIIGGGADLHLFERPNRCVRRALTVGAVTAHQCTGEAENMFSSEVAVTHLSSNHATLSKQAARRIWLTSGYQAV